MLRSVFIYVNNERIYDQEYGKAMDDQAFANVYRQIEEDAYKNAADKVEYHDFFKYRVSYISEPSRNVIFIFVTDLSDVFENIKIELDKVKKEFLMMFETVLDGEYDNETFKIFDPTIESIHKNLRPKISLVGYSGVGKTTLTRLIRAEEIPTEHVPTITGDIATIKIGNLHFHLWDFAGQEQFGFLWNNFIKGSDAVLLITDSTLENVEKSRFFIDLIKKEAPYAHQAIIGNKQDLPDAMPIPDIERLLGFKAYSMVATDPDNRNKMITIIADILEMSTEVSPLLAPLIERDRKVREAGQALEAGQFRQAVDLFEEVADLCIALGDDSVSQEFFEKAEKIRKMLFKFGEQGIPTPAAPSSGSLPKPPGAPAPSASNLPRPPGAPTPSASNLPRPPGAPTPSASNLPRPPGGLPKVSAPPKPAASNGAPTLPKITAPNSASPKPPAPGGSSNLSQLNAMLKGLGGPKPGAKPKIGSPKPGSAQPKISSPTGPQSPAVSAPKPATTAPSDEGTVDQKAQLNKQIMDLRIKLSNIEKVLVDLEMENITGDLSDEDYEKKCSRLKVMEEKIKGQIKDLQSYL